MDKRQELYRQSFGEAIDPNLEVAYQLKELVKEINVLNQILLSSDIGVNLRNTPIDKADKISEHYKKFLNKLK